MWRGGWMSAGVMVLGLLCACERKKESASAPTSGPAPVVDAEKSAERVKRGMGLYQSGDYESALKEFEEAVRLNPGNATALYERGHLFLRKGENEKAAQDLAAAVRMDPTNYIGQVNLG